jgi:hypothetical protein
MIFITMPGAKEIPLDAKKLVLPATTKPIIAKTKLPIVLPML